MSNTILYPASALSKVAEQSAAEILALSEIPKFGQMLSLSLSLHVSMRACNYIDEIKGDIQYIGAAATTKREAQIKAAHTALLAIQGMLEVCEITDPLVTCHSSCHAYIPLYIFFLPDEKEIIFCGFTQ
ncbi:double-stranded RNA-binding protein 8 [Carex littledalei]|uniref:Double-stranded RNA-binding protein 8 n=1 Tax=Carex littledalei TaxID=544730 RepID=A0A833VWU5_9POAL|nr:double-stranded RNA-binding protein 8 [Carex littledalei]